MKMEAPSGKPKAMILSVGGATVPIVASLNAQQPALVCFFVSPESRHKIKEEILDKLAYQPVHHDWIETPSAEDLLACYRTLLRELPRLADKWKVPLADFVADYTGGTKTMSVALALATVQQVGRYTYVGGTERTKDGLGIVVDGKERMLYQANPWDALAVSARQRASLLFARGRYEAAAEEYEGVANRVSVAEQGLYGALANLARGYTVWDRFDHRVAQDLLSRCLRALEPFAMGSGDQSWQALVMTVRRHTELLQQLRQPENGHLRVADLIANAKRRGDLEARYDDAVARLYSALEMVARVQLEQGHGVRTSNVTQEQVPASIREEFCQRYGAVRPDGTRYLKLPLYAAFRLLGDLQDPLGSRYFASEAAIQDLIGERNRSILAHGDRPVGETVYRRLLPMICGVAAVREADLPVFPVLPT
jgi:CRISPR-associated protein (TIGR02710 family)